MSLPKKVTRKLRKLANLGRNLQLKSQVKNIRKTESKSAYIEHPQVSIILQFFNKRQNIPEIISALRKTKVEELIVIDDGSIDGSFQDWLKHLNRPNDFLLRCNDIFEVRTYDRAIRMAKGEYICLLQDDDIPPANNNWIEQAIALFESFPKLLMLGGRNGLDLLIPDPVKPGEEPEYKRFGNLAGCPGVNKYKVYDAPFYQEVQHQIPFMFTTVVNRAPTFIRRALFLELGGINQEFAPFQCDDADASIRAWLAGYQVGLYHCDFQRDVGTGGMRLFNQEKISVQAAKNWGKIYTKYADLIADGSLQKRVDEANTGLINQSLMK